MKKFSVRFFEILCVAVLCVFIVYMLSNDTYSDKTVKQVRENLISSIDIDGLSRIKSNKIKEEFGFDLNTMHGFCYYASDSIMDVRELMIIKLNEGEHPDAVMDIIEKRITEKQKLFDGYAPNESSLLKNYKLKYSDGFIFYAVGDFSAEALELFLSMI